MPLESLEPRLLLSGTAYVVDSLADVVDADGMVTLREAIEAANTNAAIGDVPAGSADAMDVITFAPTLAGGTITLDGGELRITDSLSIVAPVGAPMTLDAASNSRVLRISGADEQVALSGLTITGGYGGDYGGGIYNADSVLTLMYVTLRGNATGDEGHFRHRGGSGLYNHEGEVTMSNVLISGNTTVHGKGGGISNYSGTLSLTNTTIVQNRAVLGGGIRNRTGTVTLTNVTITRNRITAINGNGSGGILNAEGSVVLVNTVVSANYPIAEQDIYGGYSMDHSFIGTADGYAMLAPVTDDDGFVRYYIPQPGSPLIDAGDNALAVDPDGDPLTADQRGWDRIVSGTVDIGAIEFDLAALVPGDADFDGDVDLEDFVILKTYFPMPTGATFAVGDFDFDGDVDLDDFVILKKNFAAAAQPAASSAATTNDLLTSDPAAGVAPSRRSRWMRRGRWHVATPGVEPGPDFDALAVASVVLPL